MNDRNLMGEDEAASEKIVSGFFKAETFTDHRSKEELHELARRL